MSDRFFLDTNVFVYLFDQSASGKAEISRQLFHEGLDSGKGVISYQVVQEFFNVAYKRFRQPMFGEQAEQFLNTVFRPMWTVQPSPRLFLQAFRLVGGFHLHWYDALIIAAAVEAQCRILYTEDLQNGQTFQGVEVRNPFV